MKLLQIFFEECEENLQAMERGVLRLEVDPADVEALNTVFRAVHSIKGGAASFDMPAVASFSHDLEEMLDRMRKGQVPVTGERINVILEAADCLKKMLAAQRGEGTAEPSQVAGVLERIAGGAVLKTADTEEPFSLSAEMFVNRFRVSYRPNPLCLSRGEDPLQALTRLSRQLTVTTLTARCDDLPPLGQLSPDVCYIWWEMEGTSGLPRELLLRNIAGMVGGGIEVQVTASVDDAAGPDLPQSLTDRPQSLLGSILVGEGLVSEEQLSQALANQPPDKKLGEVLVENGVLTPLQLGSALNKQKAINRSRGEASIRVDSRKLDRLVNLSGELTITRSLLSQGTFMEHCQDAPGLKDAVERLERHTRDLQETAMSLRMLPVGNIFNRFPRMVRDLAAMCDKKVTLVVTGENTELDKGIIEHLGDPLTHLIRNAIDHGIGPPGRRVEAGKPEAATIRLKACEEAGTVIISIEDDGRGLDREAIICRALSLGLLKKEERPAELTDQEVHALIFQPGFSTTDTVTDISGRGVGLDVVKKAVETLGGTVGITTGAGTFTRFVLRLPLTMAIIEGQVVRVGDERFVIPVTSIVESRRPLPSEVKTVQGCEEVLFWREGYLPFIRLYEVLGGSAWETEPSNALVVIVEVDGRRYALLVDELLEQQPMVIKGLGSILPRVPGIAGATILSDGGVILILDIPAITTLAERREHVGN